MKKHFLVIILIFIVIKSNAQRNPNTNATKIKKDTTINQTNPNDSLHKKAATTIESFNDLNNITDNSYTGFDNKTVQFGAAINYGNDLYNEDILSNGIGFSIKIGYNLLHKTKSVISIYTGLGFDYLFFGGKKIEKPNNVTLAINSNAYGWYPYIDFEIGKSSWPVILFGNSYWGGRFFYTRQNINYLDSKNVKKIDSRNIDGDNTLIYGFGGGIKIKIIDKIRLEIKYQRNYGNVSAVINPSTIKFDSFGNLDSYQKKSIDTDLDMIFLGIVLCL